ncbi:hypothetical protein STENM327S_00552 [Streptomyces tendae]
MLSEVDASALRTDWISASQCWSGAVAAADTVGTGKPAGGARTDEAADSEPANQTTGG